MEKKKIGKKQTALVLSIFAIAVLVSSLMVGAVSAHMLYIEAEDKPDAPSVQAAILNYGHPNHPEGNRAPPLKEVKQYRPDGTVVDLKPIEKPELNCSLAYFLYQGGVNIIGAVKEPSAYDPAWYKPWYPNASWVTGPPKLSLGYAKIVICAGDEENTEESGMISWAKVTGQGLEIVPLVNPFALHVGDTFEAALLYNGAPVNGSYAAAQGTHSMHPPEGQEGKTAEDGTFSVNINEAGMWQVKADYTIDESGTWIATCDKVYKGETFYNEGDPVPYEVVSSRATLTFYVP